jgi:uncharacterized protein
MSLRDRIPEDIKSALKNRERLELTVLRMLQSAIKNREIENKKRELTDEEVIGVISTEIKKRREAAKEYEKVGRPDAAADEKAEMNILMKYMPEQMGETQIRSLISKAITDTESSGMKDMGKVMKEVMPKVKGKADGALVNKLVKEGLENTEGE